SAGRCRAVARAGVPRSAARPALARPSRRRPVRRSSRSRARRRQKGWGRASKLVGPARDIPTRPYGRRGLPAKGIALDRGAEHARLYGGQHMAITFTRRSFVGAAALAGALPSALRAAPTVFPTGTTIYDPAKAWSGYTVLSTLDTPAVLVIDMNGRTVKRWDGFNLSAGGPARVLPGGVLVGPQGAFPRHQESTALVAVDFAGNELWRFDAAEEIEIDGVRQGSARQHHDWQSADWPAGYYSPDFSPGAVGGRTLLLTHTSHSSPAVAGVLLEDDRLVEVDDEGRVTWEWRAADHIDELGFAPAARAAI